MKVWLDDQRPAPAEYQRHCLTAQEAIDLLNTGAVTLISLDHDLGDEAKVGNGYQVAKHIEYLAHEGKLNPIEVRVHTQNPVGRKNILAAIESANNAWWQQRGEAYQRALRAGVQFATDEDIAGI